jgi:hypothetical protein
MPGSRQVTEHDLRIHCTIVLCYPNGSEKGEAPTARTRMRPWRRNRRSHASERQAIGSAQLARPLS